MDPLAAMLVAVGVIVLVVGLLMRLPGASRLGRLPGDVRAERGPVRFYAPLGTSLLLSVLLTIALNAAFCGGLR